MIETHRGVLFLEIQHHNNNNNNNNKISVCVNTYSDFSL